MNNITKEFLVFTMKRLSELKKLEVLTYPKIKITQNKEETKTLAHYQPSNDEIVCYVKNRLMADVFRSIAHEIVHFFQKYNNELDLYSGETGSDIENEANSLAGVILREFGEIRPEIFYNSFNVRDTSLVKIEINEYGNNVYQKILQKNEKGYDEDKLKYYIGRFEQIKSSNKVQEKDILKYSIDDLINIVNQFPEKNDNTKVILSDSELIYDKYPIQILYGKDEKACIKIKGNFDASWCISRSGNSDNLYNDYRRKEGNPTFYFVKNLEKLKNTNRNSIDPYSFFVIRIESDGKYLVTDVNNSGDKNMTYDEICLIEPKLKGLEKIFKHKEITDDENEEYHEKKYIEWTNLYNSEGIELNKLLEKYTNEKIKQILKYGVDNSGKPLISIILKLTKSDSIFIRLLEDYYVNLTDIDLIDLIQKNNEVFYNHKCRDEFINRLKNSKSFSDILFDDEYEPNIKFVRQYEVFLRKFNNHKDAIDNILKKDNIKESENKEKHKYGCLMLKTNIPNWSEISNVIKEDDLFIEDDKFGREDEQHITILYGFLEDTNVETIKEYIKNTQSVDFLIKGVSIFENEKFDVVKLSIESENLNELNKYFSENYKNENKFPDYIPHMTIAYVKKGEGKKYVKNFKKAIKSSSNKFFYSSPNNEKVFMDANETISECDCEENEEYKLDEYAQNIIDKLFKKFREENEKLSDEQIGHYIQRFDQLKSSPKIVQKDIMRYSFQDLEKLVDSFPTKMKSQKSHATNDVQFSDGELIYNKAPLQLFHGDSPKQCVKIKGDFPATWCISRTSGNMYHNYRFGNAEPSFYFVKNLERLNKIKRLEDDPYCFFVIQINNQGKYIVTSALNNGDNELTWEQLLQIEPLLNGTQKLFIQKKLSGDDRNDYSRFKNGISDEEYSKLSFEEKKKYISIKTELNLEKFRSTPKELINDYITMGVELNHDQIKFIQNDKQLFNNFRRIVLKKMKNSPEDLFANRIWFSDDELALILNNVNYKISPNLDKSILQSHPNIFFKNIEKINMNAYDDDELIDILIKCDDNPELFEKYLYDRFKKMRIKSIFRFIRDKPKYINFFKNLPKDINNNDSYNLSLKYFLIKNPNLIDFFKNSLNILSDESVYDILIEHPNLKKYFIDRKDVILHLNENVGKDDEYLVEDDKIDKLLEYLTKKKVIAEAKYQGRSVTLNKPMRGDVKKFKVYVKNKEGKVVKVNFGSKDYNIKKNNPNRKKSYCSRSKGIEGGGKDKTKANYWSRKQWKC